MDGGPCTVGGSPCGTARATASMAAERPRPNGPRPLVHGGTRDLVTPARSEQPASAQYEQAERRAPERGRTGKQSEEHDPPPSPLSRWAPPSGSVPTPTLRQSPEMPEKLLAVSEGLSRRHDALRSCVRGTRRGFTAINIRNQAHDGPIYLGRRGSPRRSICADDFEAVDAWRGRWAARPVRIRCRRYAARGNRGPSTSTENRPRSWIATSFTF